MVNPGVIELVSLEDMKRLNIEMNFRVEDNLGESIHIHYEDFRIDLTVKEFQYLADLAGPLLNELISCEGFDYKDFDPTTIMGNAEKLLHLQRIKYAELRLDEITIPAWHEHKEGDPIELRHVLESAIYKALTGDMGEENTVSRVSYFQSPFRRCTNEERIDYQLKRVKENGYPMDGDVITLNDNNELIDGWHRASVLRYLYGNICVPVRKLIFDTQVFDVLHFNQEHRGLAAQRRKEIERLKEFCTRCEQIFLYGAGKWGGRYYFLLNSLNIFVDGFIETEKHKDIYLGRPVYSADDYLKRLPANSGVILSVYALSADKARENLHISEEFFFEPDRAILNWYAYFQFND